MTHTRTWTYEERAWELALASCDPHVSDHRKEVARTELQLVLEQAPSVERIVAACLELGGAIARLNR